MVVGLVSSAAKSGGLKATALTESHKADSGTDWPTAAVPPASLSPRGFPRPFFPPLISPVAASICVWCCRCSFITSQCRSALRRKELWLWLGLDERMPPLGNVVCGPPPIRSHLEFLMRMKMPLLGAFRVERRGFYRVRRIGRIRRVKINFNRLFTELSSV